MNRPSEALISEAESSGLPGKIPFHLIRPLLELSCLPPKDRDEYILVVQNWLNRRASVLSTASSGASSIAAPSIFSSNRSTQHSFASSNTTYSSRSTGQYGVLSTPLVPKFPHTFQTTRNNEEDRANSVDLIQHPQGLVTANRARSPRPTASNLPHTPGSTPSEPAFYCPWCRQSNSRPAELKKHMLQFCCSNKVHVCLKCGTHARTKQQMKTHKSSDRSGECKKYDFGERFIDYNRQAFGCERCGKLCLSFDDYWHHITRTKGPAKDCNTGLYVGVPERIRQIRALLQQPSLSYMAGFICRIQRGPMESVNSLEWAKSQKDLAEIAERLEYGPLEVEEGQLNCGIPQDELFDFLTNLIGNALPPGSATSRSTDPQDASVQLLSPLPSSDEPTNLALSSDDEHKPLPSIPQADQRVETWTMPQKPNHEKDIFKLPPIPHRNKRPISHTSAQHPDSVSRSQYHPRAGPSAAAQAAAAHLRRQAEEDRHRFNQSNDFHDMLGQFPDVPKTTRSDQDQAPEQQNPQLGMVNPTIVPASRAGIGTMADDLNILHAGLDGFQSEMLPDLTADDLLWFQNTYLE